MAGLVRKALFVQTAQDSIADMNHRADRDGRTCTLMIRRNSVLNEQPPAKKCTKGCGMSLAPWVL